MDLLRQAMGTPSGDQLDHWSALDEAVQADEAGAREALRSASVALPSLAAAVAERQALATAVISRDGEVRYAEPAFRALFEDAADFRPLLVRAVRSGSAVGLVDGEGGASFTAWAGDADAAARWPLERATLEALAGGRGRLAVVVSAPSRSSELARRAARALDLTPLEARLAEALLFAPNLETAAAQAGVGSATARDALRRLHAKAGVRRTPEFVSRLVEIMCAGRGEETTDEALAVEAFGLTPGEARVAALTARGATAPEAAEVLGVSTETIKTHLKTTFGKTGARRAKDLSRLFAEARELVAFTGAAESVCREEEEGGRLRIVPAQDGARRIALIDYGPDAGEPAFVFHGAASGRRLPPAFLAALQGAGLRPIVVQRPGFGLTDPARGNYVRTAARDLVSVVERLKLGEVRLLAREEGVPVALEFARLRPELLRRGVVLNPPPPSSVYEKLQKPGAAVHNILLRNRVLVGAFAEFLRRQATAETLERLVRQTCSRFDGDRAWLEDPAVLPFIVRDIQALCARSARGFVAEHELQARGWTPPEGLACRPLVVAHSSGLRAYAPDWLNVPIERTVILENGGVLTPYSHPAELADLLTADRA